MSELMTFSLSNKKVVTNDMQSVTTMAQMWGFRPLKAKAFFGTPAGTETVHRTVSILRIALFESRSLQQK